MTYRQFRILSLIVRMLTNAFARAWMVSDSTKVLFASRKVPARTFHVSRRSTWRRLYLPEKKTSKKKEDVTRSTRKHRNEFVTRVIAIHSSCAQRLTECAPYTPNNEWIIGTLATVYTRNHGSLSPLRLVLNYTEPRPRPGVIIRVRWHRAT